MISMAGLLNKVKNALNINQHPLCQHVFKENGQVWDKIGPKQFQLKTRYTCKLCKDDRLETIGEK